MRQSQPKAKPFRNSLAALAQVAVREAGADGYAFFQRTANPLKLVREDAGGSAITEDKLDRALRPMDVNPLIVTYPLGTDGVLAFAFHDHARFEDVRGQLDRLAGIIESVWLAAHDVVRYAQLAHQVAELETCLMDSKIADRALGFLTTRGQNPTDATDAITRHVEGVLRETATRRTLQQISRTLEEEVKERRLVGQAKTILQNSQGMSEEEAHVHLRVVSRKSRRKLKDVALEIIERHSIEEPVHG